MFGREGASVLTPLFRLQIPNDTSRKIIHVDMDAFYASIEMRDDPSLRTRALVIAHDPRQTGGKGVITTANYVARQYGVNSAMPAIEAVRKVPRRLLVFKDPDFEKYHAVSDQIHDIFHQVTDLIEPIALDEAYLDVTNNTHFPTTIALALWLQQTIERQTRLTCAIGVSYNRFLAKMASEFNKPGGRTVVTPGMAQEFLAPQPIGKFRGVGKKTLPRLQALGIETGADLLAADPGMLQREFGKAGFMLALHARGIDNHPIEVKERKSIGKERTYNPPLQSSAAVRQELTMLAGKVSAELRKKQRHGTTVVLKVRDVDFNTQTRRMTRERYFVDADDILDAAWTLYNEETDTSASLRLVGITITGLVPLTFENVDLPLR
ncbi:DNA polymerase IV [Lacticaseibacillus pantheris]